MAIKMAILLNGATWHLSDLCYVFWRFSHRILFVLAFFTTPLSSYTTVLALCIDMDDFRVDGATVSLPLFYSVQRRSYKRLLQRYVNGYTENPIDKNKCLTVIPIKNITYKYIERVYLHFLYDFFIIKDFLYQSMNTKEISSKMKEIRLGSDKPSVALHSSVITRAEARNKFIVIGRPVNPRRQHIPSIVKFLPRSWNADGLAHGRMIENQRFQFILPNVETLDFVLQRGPWSFSERMLVIHRWTPGFNMANLDFLPIWVQIRGIPFHLFYVEIIENVATKLGENNSVIKVDTMVDAAHNGNFVRVCMNWYIHTPLEFQRSFQFTPGEDTILYMRYEKLRNYCEGCGLMTHDTGACPTVLVAPNHMDPPSDDDNPGPDMNDPRMGQLAASGPTNAVTGRGGSPSVPPGFRTNHHEADYNRFLQARAQHLNNGDNLSPLRNNVASPSIEEDPSEASQDTMEYDQNDLASNESDLVSTLTENSGNQAPVTVTGAPMGMEVTSQETGIFSPKVHNALMQEPSLMSQTEPEAEDIWNGIEGQLVPNDDEIMDIRGKRKRVEFDVAETSTTRLIAEENANRETEGTEEETKEEGVCGLVDPYPPGDE